MIEFVAAAKEAPEVKPEDDFIECSYQGFEFKAYRPKDGQLAMLMSSMGTRKGLRDNMAGIIDFFFGVIDERAVSHFEGRLMDRSDDFEVEDLTGIMRGLVKEWTARPTKQPSASTSSPPSTGSPSTEVTRVSI